MRPAVWADALEALARPDVAIALATAALSLALIVRLLRRRPVESPRCRRVRALARRGLEPGEIARRTGLARDAVALALQAMGPADRPKLPPTAPFADAGATPGRGRSFAVDLQVAMRQTVAGGEAPTPGRARRLPLRWPGAPTRKPEGSVA